MATAGDDLDVYVSLIQNREANEFVRWSAATGLARLVVAGLRGREEIVELLRGLLREAIADEDVDGVQGLLHTLVDLYPEEAYNDIEEAYERDLVATFMIGLEDVEETIDRGKEDALGRLARRGVYIDDTVETLRHWGAFRPREERKAPRTPPPSPTPVRPLPDTVPDAPATLRDTVRHDQARVRRNDPCPCGSGLACLIASPNTASRWSVSIAS